MQHTGLHQTPEQIVEAAIQEDADAVGISILSGAHEHYFKAIIDLLAEKNASDLLDAVPHRCCATRANAPMRA